MIHLRRAGQIDAAAMAELLNAIIARGGTTALTTSVTTDEIRAWMARNAQESAWTLAETDGGTIMGFQWIAPADHLPREACDIATFVKIGETGIGIGSRLFERTCEAARALGYAWINATIRSDNAGGLAYYQSRGFEFYAREEGVRLGDGTVVSREMRRFDL